MFTRYFPLFYYNFIMKKQEHENKNAQSERNSLHSVQCTLYSRSYKNSGCLDCMSKKIQQISCFDMILFSISILNILRKTNSIQSMSALGIYKYDNQVCNCLINVALCFTGPTFESGNNRSIVL